MPQWQQGVGSGAVTQKISDAIGTTPELQAAFDQNKYIPGVASAQVNKISTSWLDWGDPRPDLQNLRLTMAQGPGWVDRAKAGLAQFKAKSFLRARARRRQGRRCSPNCGLPGDADRALASRCTSRNATESRTTIGRLVGRQLQAQRFADAGQ